MDNRFTVRELHRGRRPGDRFVRVARAGAAGRSRSTALRVASHLKGLVGKLPAGRRA
ncbi:MAG TPA: hypothetical protein VIO14_14515 [Dehalococcoidia bacterium]